MCNWQTRGLVLLREERGAVAVEAGMYFVVFFLLCTLLVDFSAVFLNKGHLERVNHSLASVLRERTAFYNARELLTQEDVDMLNELAGLLLADSRLARQYQLTVSAVHFKVSGSKTEKKVLRTQLFIAGGATCKAIVPTVNSAKVAALSPWALIDKEGSSFQRWLPVYQVTLCVPGGESLFKRFLGLTGTTIGDIFASDVVLPR